MNRKVCALAIAALAGCGGGNHTQPAEPPPSEPAATTAAVKAAPPFAEGNGAVIAVPLQGTAQVAFRVMFYTGSADDPPGKEGLTALAARLIAEGGSKRQSYPEILRALYPMAAQIDAWVEREQTVFTARVHPDHVQKFVPILSEVIREPRLPESDFARLRDDMINDIEKRLRATDDENLGKEMLNSMLYAGHPYGHFDGGTLEGLRAITLDDVRAHAAKVFGKKRMLIGIGGAVDDAMKTIVRDELGKLPDGEPRMAQLARVAKPAKHEVLIAEKPGKAVAISIGYPHDAFRGHPDFDALKLVQSYFGEHRQFHGVLMSEMREKRGLNYGDYAYVEKFIQDGWSRNVLTNISRRQQHFEIWIRPVDPKDTVFAIRLATYLLDRLVREGVPEPSVDETKKFLIGYTRLWDLTPSRKVGWALDDHFYGAPSWLESYRKHLETMRASDVKAAIGRHLVARPLKIAIVAPDPAALKAQLLSGEKTTKEYASKPDDAVLKMDEQVSVYPLGLTEADIKIVKVEELFVR